MTDNELQELTTPDAATLQTALCRPSSPQIVPPGSASYALNGNDLALAAQVGLASNGELNSNYAAIYNLYRRVFSSWLLSQTDLASYDQQIVDSELGFVSVSQDKQTFHQLYSTLGLQFIYIRNDFHVERLSAADVATLKAHLNDPAYLTAPSVLDVITRTSARVLRPADVDGDVQGTFDATGFFFPNQAIVLYVAYQDQWDSKGNEGPAYSQQRAFIDATIIPTMESEIAAAIGRPVVGRLADVI